MTASPDLFHDVPVGLVTVDADGFIREVNRTLLTWIGAPRDAVIGTPFLNLLPPPDKIFFETRLTPTLHLQGEVREIALAMNTADAPLPILLNARNVGSDVLLAIFDATERQGYERALLTAQRHSEASESRVRTLQESASGFLASASETQLAETLVASARHAMAASACAVLLLDAHDDTIIAAGENPLAEVLADPALRAELQQMRDAGVVTISSLDDARERYPWVVDGMIAARVEAFSSVPIGPRDQVLGALLCFFGRARELSPEDVELQLALVQQAFQALSRLRLQAELTALALHDQLTGVANRRLLREHLVQGLAAAGRRHQAISMLVLDLDEFKTVNDQRGHQAGDAVLRWVADALVASVRADDVVGRFGGDEFLVICHDADSETASGVAERIRAEISRYPDGLPSGEPLTASVGVAVCSAEMSTSKPEELFAVADAALYASKRAGKNRVTVDWL